MKYEALSTSVSEDHLRLDEQEDNTIEVSISIGNDLGKLALLFIE